MSADEVQPVKADPVPAGVAPAAKSGQECGPGSTYFTPLHPEGIKDTSKDFKAGPLRFNPCVSGVSFVLIWAFCIWCIIHDPCKATKFAGTCSLQVDGSELNKEECVGLASGVSWQAAIPAHCWQPGTPMGTIAVAPAGSANWTSEDSCNNACDDCQQFYPPSRYTEGDTAADWTTGENKPCPCPCPLWVDEEEGPGGQKAYCKVSSGSGDTTAKELTDMLEGYDEATCKELIANTPVWEDEEDADSSYARPLFHNGKIVTAANASSATTSTDCAAAGGIWKQKGDRPAASLTGQPAIVADSGTCIHYSWGCPATNTRYDTEDAFDSDYYDVAQDWSANGEFAKWKQWVAAKFNWFYIGSQDVWIVFIIVVYFSKYSDIKLCKKGDEEQPPEYSDASWFSMLFCSGIGVGLFYFGVAEPVWHYTDGTSRYTTNPNLTDEQVAQDAMNLTFFHWGLHGFVVYTQVGLILGIMSYRWGLPMTMKSCFYPLLGDAIFGVIGDIIDIVSVITTLFGVCTSLGLGTMQLAQGLQRLTYDDRTGESAIMNTKGTQVAVIAFITLIATLSVVSGIKKGIQRLSNIAFSMGLMILFIGFFIGDSYYMLNVFVQSVGYYIQWVIQLGSHTSAFATSPFELWDAHGKDLSPTASPAGASHSMNVENKAWMDWWTLFYWGWWIAWSPFVGTFMAKISKGRTIKQFILGSCILPVLFGFIWFTVFGGVGIEMSRDAKAMGITAGKPQITAVLETTQVGVSGGGTSGVAGVSQNSVSFVNQGPTSSDARGRYGCDVIDAVHTCAADINCQYKYLREPSLMNNLAGRSKEDMWYDVMLSYGEPDGFLGWLLFVFSMISLVLYFVTSSDSGSLVIDILSANGVDEPPVLQRIFWALTEGFTASALMIAGGSNSLNALSTVSICAGLPYTVLLCFVCTAIWRALQMDAGDLVYSADNQFSVRFSDIITDLSNWPKFIINLFCPVLVILKHGNMFYVIGSVLLFYSWPILQFVNLASHGWWAVGWMSYLMFTLIVMDIRTKARTQKGIHGNIVEDFFAVFLFYPGALIQLDAHFAAKNSVTVLP